LQGLGYLGFGKAEEAKKAFLLALSEDENHIGVRVHLRMLHLVAPTGTVAKARVAKS
jgi:hypothetical protein